MCDSICGAVCSDCQFKSSCQKCAASGGKPFGKECLVASYCQKDRQAFTDFKEKLIDAFNSLGIKDMKKVDDLNALKGSFINLEYTMPGGGTVKLWDDDKIYLGNQLCKENSNRCYGIAADENYLMVSEYGNLGADAEIIVFKQWNK